VEKLVSVSAPHPNLCWTNLPVNSVLNQTWFDFVQLPRVPEAELKKTGEKFLAKFYSHLARERLYCTDLPETSSIDIWDAYKYVFSQNSDWNGPLNYFRNFLFYRIAGKAPLRCPCLVVTGEADGKVEVSANNRHFITFRQRRHLYQAGVVGQKCGLL
jgi:epoxide hydrolase 4